MLLKQIPVYTHFKSKQPPVHKCWQQLCSQLPKTGRNQKVLQRGASYNVILCNGERDLFFNLYTKLPQNVDESWTHIIEWRQPVGEGYILYDSIYTTFWKLEMVNKSVVARSLERREGWSKVEDSRVSLEWWKYSVWHNNGVDTWLWICQNLQNVTAQRANPHVCKL